MYANRIKAEAKKVADVIRDAGGTLVGRTRLQKTAYILEITGLGEGFSFEYRHYGPFSEELALATRNADVLGLVSEEERPASWGGLYSIFTVREGSGRQSPKARRDLAKIAVDADPIELELAATAAFLKLQGEMDPWGETERRKPEKAENGRLKKAKELYAQLRRVPTPIRLPEI